MDTSRGGTPAVLGVAEVRADIDAARTRVAATLEALRFKADLPARLGDSVGNAVVTFTEHVFDRLTAQDGEAIDRDRVTVPVSNEAAVRAADEPGRHMGPAAAPG